MRLQVDQENWFETALATIGIVGLLIIFVLFATGGDALLKDLHLERDQPTIGAHHE